jgi:hypothetical protein
MSLDPRIEQLRRGAAVRRSAIALACALPPLLASIVLLARIGGRVPAIAAAALSLGAVALYVQRVWRSVDSGWLARRLDATAPPMDDSAELLFRDADTLAPLQSLQRARLHARLDTLALDLRPAWPRRTLVLSGALALLLFALAAAWSPLERVARTTAPAQSPDTAAVATRLVFSELVIAPPAYTRAPPRTENGLDARMPQGSSLRWRLRFDPTPAAVTLQFHDGSHLALARNGDDWVGERVLDASALYRIVPQGAPALADDRLHRLDALPDLAPEIRAIQPDKTLTLIDAQQKTWNLLFEASDDYGIARAELSITHAQGTGENIAFKEQTVALTGVPIDDARHQRYAHALDLGALGIAQGDDVIVRLLLADNREPKPNTTRSASFILRWPVDASKESAGLEGIVQKTMPAYFRSQRQIIIDTEALLAEQAQLDEAKFLGRSDSIGVDQKLLRLRYGQFLGEESEGHAEHAPDTARIGGADTQAGALAGAHEAQEHAAPPTPTKFGEAGDITAEYGHVHDIAEAATLLDPDTKATLKSALAEMWQAELHLRQGHPVEALPYEHRALDFIKQVQQATRIYLARVGLELPAPDEARRLSGERKDLGDRAGTLIAAPTSDSALVALWRALDAGSDPDWDAAEHALAARGSSPEALGSIAALDRARREPTCVECRAQLRRELWPLLPVPAAASAVRATPDAAGRAYLDALDMNTPKTVQP